MKIITRYTRQLWNTLMASAWQSIASVLAYACITLGVLYWVLGWWLGR